jgi:uncharacterized protein
MTETMEARLQGPRGPLSALWSAPTRPGAVVVVAHGANNDIRHPFFEGIAQAFGESEVATLRFNFPYMEAGWRSPDRPPVLMDAWAAALQEAGRRGGGKPVIASGKSLGGRMASLLAAERPGEFTAAGLVFFGYPLHAPGRADQPRDAHLPSVGVPMLFIQGTADSLARFDLLEDLTRRLGPQTRLHRVEGGDHSFRVRGAKRPDHEMGRELGVVAAGFVHEVVAGTAGLRTG